VFNRAHPLRPAGPQSHRHRFSVRDHSPGPERGDKPQSYPSDDYWKTLQPSVRFMSQPWPLTDQPRPGRFPSRRKISDHIQAALFCLQQVLTPSSSQSIIARASLLQACSIHPLRARVASRGRGERGLLKDNPVMGANTRILGGTAVLREPRHPPCVGHAPPSRARDPR